MNSNQMNDFLNNIYCSCIVLNYTPSRSLTVSEMKVFCAFSIFNICHMQIVQFQQQTLFRNSKTDIKEYKKWRKSLSRSVRTEWITQIWSDVKGEMCWEKELILMCTVQISTVSGDQKSAESDVKIRMPSVGFNLWWTVWLDTKRSFSASLLSLMPRCLSDGKHCLFCCTKLIEECTISGGVTNDRAAYCSLQDSEMSDTDPLPGPETSSMEGENAPLYCICRKPDINCFMMWVHSTGTVSFTIYIQ